MQLRVMTYNIRGGLGMDGRRSIRRIAEVVRSADPDLAGIQEVHDRLPMSGFARQPAALTRLTGLPRVFHPSLALGIGRYGNLWLTKLPVIESGVCLLPGGREQRAAVWATIGAPSHPFRAIVTHLGLTAEEKVGQTSELVSIVRAAREPLILVGDMNARPGSDELAQLADAGLRHAVGPESPTYPADDPRHRIDYIMCSRHWTTGEARVLDTQASDHLPLVVELSL